jgi:hypothetical protein
LLATNALLIADIKEPRKEDADPPIVAGGEEVDVSAAAIAFAAD